MKLRISRRLVAAVGVVLLLVGCGEDSPTSNGQFQGELVVELTWGDSGNMDVGATTPGGIISANFSGNDPNCTHSGDDLGNTSAPFVETMTCMDPADTGNYTIVVENFAANAISYTLTVKVNGQDVSNFPILKALAAGGRDDHMFTL
ncbi:MAG TPA: hypothetical protein VKU85_05345 [bacterium]|nr:hypothetical protein [bacterium]